RPDHRVRADELRAQHILGPGFALVGRERTHRQHSPRGQQPAPDRGGALAHPPAWHGDQGARRRLPGRARRGRVHPQVLAQGIGDAEHRGAPQFPRTGGPAHQHGECPGRTAHFADRGQALVRDSLRRIARGVLSVHRSPVHLRPAGVTVRRLAFVLTGIALLAGCGAPEGSPIATATVTDSAGIRIVTSTAPAWAEGRGWSVDTIPELVIGDERTLPSVLLVGITAARRLDRGGYLVTTAVDALIRWFDRNGAEQRRAGGSGTGPGEFRDIELPGING